MNFGWLSEASIDFIEPENPLYFDFNRPLKINEDMGGLICE